MNWLNNVTKDLKKSGIVIGHSKPPRYWFSTGNHVLNKIISGSCYNGIPQGRLTCFCGPSGAGKSFLVANAIVAAQEQQAAVVVLDSENALDDNFMSGVGINTDENYTYIDTNTIPEAKKIVSKIITEYKKQYNDDSEAPKLLIVIDSLDMLMTETEQQHFDKGVSKGDQGQRNKQLKQMLREFVQAIKHSNISIIITAQVYKNQDVMNGEGLWIVSDAVKFSLSQIVMLTKLKMKDSTTRKFTGIRMKCEGYKTRFTQPFQTVTIEVPYEKGMDKFNGLLDVAIELGVVEQCGSRYKIKNQNDTWYSKHFNQYQDVILELVEQHRTKFLEGLQDEQPDKVISTSVKQRRLNNAENKIDQPNE